MMNTNLVCGSSMRSLNSDPAKPQFYPYLKLTKQPSPHLGIILHFNGTFSEVMHGQLASNCTDNPRNLFTMSAEMPIFD